MIVISKHNSSSAHFRRPSNVITARSTSIFGTGSFQISGLMCDIFIRLVRRSSNDNGELTRYHIRLNEKYIWQFTQNQILYKKLATHKPYALLNLSIVRSDNDESVWDLGGITQIPNHMLLFELHLRIWFVHENTMTNNVERFSKININTKWRIHTFRKHCVIYQTYIFRNWIDIIKKKHADCHTLVCP